MKSFPDILLHDLEGVNGFDQERLLAAHGQPAATSLRLHPIKGEGMMPDMERVPWCDTGRYLKERPVFTTDPMFQAGAYYVQEASSMFLDSMIRQLIPDRKGLRVLDLCAAPGGKSTLVASLLEEDSLLISNEVIRARATILEENMTRWGYMNTWVTSNDPRDLGKLKGYFDLIIVDAPCSGSGLFRKDERALDEWSENNVELCGQRQQRILADIWPALKQDGILIYATCSYSPREDEEILDWLGENFEAQSLPVITAAKWGVATTVSPGQKYTGYRFFPGNVIGEGFFIAAIKKTGEEAAIKQPKYKAVHDAKIAAQCSYLLDSSNWICIPQGDGYVAMHKEHEVDYHILQKQVYLRKVGIELGSPVKNEWLPAHDVALSVGRSKSLPAIAVNKEQALKFLKKEDPGLGEIPKGWYLLTYNGLGLGWIKALGNRVNNYLPKHWRIRMEINDADWA